MDPPSLFVEARDVLQTCGKNDGESAIRVQFVHVLDLPGLVIIIRLHDTQQIDPQMVDAFLFSDEAYLVEDFKADRIGVEGPHHLKARNCLELCGFSAPNVRSGRVWGAQQMRMFRDLQSLASCELTTIDEAEEVRGGGGADVDRLVPLTDPVDGKAQDDPWLRSGGDLIDRFYLLPVVDRRLVYIVDSRLNGGCQVRNRYVLTDIPPESIASRNRRESANNDTCLAIFSASSVGNTFGWFLETTISGRTHVGWIAQKPTARSPRWTFHFPPDNGYGIDGVQ